jgi:hypothetical protein
MHEMKAEILYLDGCPNYQDARALVADERWLRDALIAATN